MHWIIVIFIENFEEVWLRK